ncbi:MAG: hypothetical protein WC655_16705 [Candidatus Hydrogenedentales bacterium]|jgi:hypothetical protein
MLILLVLTLGATNETKIEKLLTSIERVESAGRGSLTPDGDRGRSVGPYQISKAYYRDSGISILSEYRRVRDRAFARRVVLAYWARYERQALRSVNAEALARCHNGGWNWRKKIKATDAYWRRVEKEMRKR